MNMRVYENAMRDARILMGRKPNLPFRRKGSYRAEWKTEDDPLAWWCLVELLVAYAAGKKSK